MFYFLCLLQYCTSRREEVYRTNRIPGDTQHRSTTTTSTTERQVPQHSPPLPGK